MQNGPVSSLLVLVQATECDGIIGIYGFDTEPDVYIMDKVCSNDPLQVLLPHLLDEYMQSGDLGNQ